MAFNSIYFGTVTGFNTVIAIATEGFLSLVRYASSRRVIISPISQIRIRIDNLTGPWAMRPVGSRLLVNGVGLAYLLFACMYF